MFWEPIVWNTFSDSFIYINNSYESINIFLNILLGQIIMLIGFLGIIKRVTSILLVLLSLELTLLGINFSIIFLGLLLNQPICLIISLLLLVLSAVETVIGLSLVFLYHKAYNTTALNSIAQLRF